MNNACRVALIWGSHINIITHVAIYQRMESGGVSFMTLSRLGKAIMAHTCTPSH